MGRKEENYLKWLARQIKPDRDRDHTDLFRILYAKEFVWLIPNDDNRVRDGLDIRDSFFNYHSHLDQGCSVLEVLIGISRRIAFAAGGDPHLWAWRLLENLELNRVSGRIGAIRAERVDDILERLIWRMYEPNGVGGFFPLAWPQLDQRGVEIWYQMHAYIEELPEL